MKIETIWLEVKWELRSEKWFSDWYEIYLAYRDVWTWQFELISRKKLDLSEVDWNNLWFERINYEIFWENVKIHWEWKDIVLVFNWKYRELILKEKDVFWWTIIHKEDFTDFDNINTWDLRIDNFVENSVKKAQDIYYDPFIQSYINEERFTKDPNLSWITNEEYDEFVNKYWSELALDKLNIRETMILKMKEEWKSRKEIFNFVFDKLNLKERFEKEWYSKNEIEFIRDNWMNSSLKVIESRSVPDHIQRINELILKNKKIDLSKEIWWKDLIKKEDSNVNLQENNETTKNETAIEIWIKEEELVKNDQFDMIFTIWFVLIFLIISFISIRIYLKKKKNEKNELNVIDNVDNI